MTESDRRQGVCMCVSTLFDILCENLRLFFCRVRLHVTLYFVAYVVLKRLSFRIKLKLNPVNSQRSTVHEQCCRTGCYVVLGKPVMRFKMY